MSSEAKALRLIRTAEEARPLKSFCGHCGAAEAEGAAAHIGSRVCGRCGMGLMLEAAADVAPTPADAFMVVDSRMSVSALSRRCERLLEVAEPDAVGRHLNEFLAPADTDAPEAQSFYAQVLLAATGGAAARTIAVRPTGEFGVRYWARVATCGTSGAALLLLFNLN
jgi:PAS domain-containing protein